MRYSSLFVIVATAFLITACHTTQTAQTTDNPPPPPTKPAVAQFVTWDKKMVDLGTVKRGEKRETTFEFTNTSGGDVQIEIVDACSCTTVEFPRGIIQPGGKGRLDVVFDSTDKEASETIGITVVFKNNDAAGNPRIESVEYKYELVK